MSYSSNPIDSATWDRDKLGSSKHSSARARIKKGSWWKRAYISELEKRLTKLEEAALARSKSDTGPWPGSAARKKFEQELRELRSQITVIGKRSGRNKLQKTEVKLDGLAEMNAAMAKAESESESEEEFLEKSKEVKIEEQITYASMAQSELRQNNAKLRAKFAEKSQESGNKSTLKTNSPEPTKSAYSEALVGSTATNRQLSPQSNALFQNLLDDPSEGDKDIPLSPENWVDADMRMNRMPCGDEGVLSPESWMDSMLQLEYFVLKRSYLWYTCSGKGSKMERDPPDSERGANASLFSSTCLPKESPSRIDQELWKNLRFTEILIYNLGLNSSKTIMEFCQDLIIHDNQGKPLSLSEMGHEIHTELETIRLGRNILLNLHETLTCLDEKFSSDSTISYFVVGDQEYPVVEYKTLSQEEVKEILVQLNDYLLKIVQAIKEKKHPWNWSEYWAFRDKRNAFNRIWIMSKFRFDWGLEDTRMDWAMLAKTLDIALISHCGAHIVSSESQLSALDVIYKRLARACKPEKLLGFRPIRLGCMSHLVSGADIWALGYLDEPLTSTFSVYITLRDLANIWGPIWQVNCKETQGFYVAVSDGVIGAVDKRNFCDPLIQSDDWQYHGAIACHYEKSWDELGKTIGPIISDWDTGLLIGARELEVQECRTSNLLASSTLTPYGTSTGARVKASSTYSMAFQYSGFQIGYQRQYKLRQGKTLKQSLLNRWQWSTENVNPRTLLLNCGLEGSLCTNNVRRRTLLDVLRSDVLASCFDRLMWTEQEIGNRFIHALTGSDPEEFFALWSQREWREDIGLAVSFLLQTLAETGVRDNQLLLFTSVEGACDPDQLVSFSGKNNTWLPLLEDTPYTATFAVATKKCLSFPYSNALGQRCRMEWPLRVQYSVFQTKIAPNPVSSVKGATASWIESIKEGDYLSIVSSKLHMLSLSKAIQLDELVMCWSGNQFLRGALARIPGRSEQPLFREVMDDGLAKAVASGQNVQIYVISREPSNLTILSRVSATLQPDTFDAAINVLPLEQPARPEIHGTSRETEIMSVSPVLVGD